MARGQLRVYLGAAPGVGKTYRMLDEGWRRRERGTDVVIGFVETHQRPLTQAQLRDLETVARVTRDYRGALLEEMDLDALLARRPQVALVDELAHSNVPGSRNEKRWRDVEVLLDAGIDVITTVNIQHLESVNDVVQRITGVAQQETVPDAVVRRAEQIELVDVTPEALRRRMAHGNIYTADKIDASLSNFFRVGNLSALRELALLWLADRVEDALRRYLDDHDITSTWETRERLIVGVVGGAVDEVLLRRAARIASRTGAELIAVHVVRADGDQGRTADTSLARSLVGEFDGRFHEVVDDNVAAALVNFSRSERGTQIVLGSPRARSLLRPFRGVVGQVLTRARDLDVHVIATSRERAPSLRRHRTTRRVSVRRQVLIVGLSAIAMATLTVILIAARASLSISSEFLAYLTVVVVVAGWAGSLVGIVAALAAFTLENYYFVAPLHTLAVERPGDVVSLVAFLIFAVGASIVVSVMSRRTIAAERARAEAQILAKVVTSVGSSRRDLLPVLDALRAVMSASSVAVMTLVEGQWCVDMISGEPPLDVSAGTRFAIDERSALVLFDVQLDRDGRQLVSAFATRIAARRRALGASHDVEEARAFGDADANGYRLLWAVAHDLRGGLVRVDHTLMAISDGVASAPAPVQRRRLDEVARDVKRLRRLTLNLLDVGALETRKMTAQYAPVQILDLVTRVLSTLDAEGQTFDVDISNALPEIVSDPHLIERALGVVLTNAGRFSPPESPVRISAGVTADTLELLVIDRGPGVTPTRRDALLGVSAQRGYEDEGAATGVALVVRIVKLLGGEVHFDDTPGGGLMVVLELPRFHSPTFEGEVEAQITRGGTERDRVPGATTPSHTGDRG